MGFSVDLMISVIFKVLLVSRTTQGAARFTVVPPSIVYVSVGETAKLVWDYSVDNRNEEFNVFSPQWVFYKNKDKPNIIAQESIFKNWKWYINSDTCPARLLNPVRVSKESTATLVIHNVTLADSGTYGCHLVLASGNPITSKVKLIVTSFPRIELNPSSTYIAVNESHALFINCSAEGTPAPNVTWYRLQGDIIDHGVGKATVNTTNITRDDVGIYKCCGSNNPNEPFVCKNTSITVQYKPEIDINSTVSLNGNKIILRCMANGVPSPRFTWYDPSNRSITTGLHDIAGGSILELVTIEKVTSGLYKCKAENILGYDEHFINVTYTDFTTPTVTTKSITDVIIPTSKGNRAQNSKSKDTSFMNQPTTVVFSTSKVHQGKASSPSEGNGLNKDTDTMTLLAAGGTVSFVLITTIIFLAVLILKKHSKEKDAEVQQVENEMPSLPLEAAENTMPIYAKVDLSKKKRNRPQGTLEDMPIYAQVDKSKKKQPEQIIYAELEDLHSTEVIPPPLPECHAYDEIDGNQNTSQTDNAEPIYACILLE